MHHSFLTLWLQYSERRFHFRCVTDVRNSTSDVYYHCTVAVKFGMSIKDFAVLLQMYIGRCGVRFHGDGYAESMVGLPTEGEFEQSVEIDGQYEKIEVPTIGDTRRATVLHDFNQVRNWTQLLQSSLFLYSMTSIRSVSLLPRLQSGLSELHDFSQFCLCTARLQSGLSELHDFSQFCLCTARLHSDLFVSYCRILLPLLTRNKSIVSSCLSTEPW